MFGGAVRRSRCHWAITARYISLQPRVPALRRSSREIVDGLPSYPGTSTWPVQVLWSAGLGEDAAGDRFDFLNGEHRCPGVLQSLPQQPPYQG